MRRPPRSLDERWARVRGPRQGGRLGWALRERAKFNERTRLDYDSYVPRTRCSASSAVHRGAGTGCSRTAVYNVPGPVPAAVALGLAMRRLVLEGVERLALLCAHLPGL